MPRTTAPLVPQTVFVPMGVELVPSSGAFAPTNWFSRGWFVAVM